MDISVVELKEKIKNKELFTLIDVREEWEFEESFIKNSKNIPLYSIPNRMNEFGDKASIIIVFCRSGVRGNIATHLLKEAGYTNVFNLIGGKVAFDA